MKKPALLTLLLCSSAFVFAQNPKDENAKKDSIQNWKKDSARIANTSPMRLQNNRNQKANVAVPANEQKRSQYTYDKDGRIIGGSTTINAGKGKKKKKN